MNIRKKEPSRFDVWIEEKINQKPVTDTLLLIDDTFGRISNIPYIKNGKSIQPSRRYINDIPNYENFIHLLVSEMFYAFERNEKDYSHIKSRQQYFADDIDGQGRSIEKSIAEIRGFINRNHPIVGKAFMHTAQKLKFEHEITITSRGENISSTKYSIADYISLISNSHHAIDKILLCFLEELKIIKNELHTSYLIEGIFFPKKLKRMLANPHMDILFFRLAMLIKDWKLEGKYISSQISANKPIYLPSGNSFPKIIASLANSFLSLSTQVDSTEVSERLKELKKMEAYLLPPSTPSMDLNF